MNMSEERKTRETEVFDQEISIDDLNAAGGYFITKPDEDKSNCIKSKERDIYGGNGFPNCAATVEDGSHCWTNDACLLEAVLYQGIHGDTGCKKAWQ